MTERRPYDTVYRKSQSLRSSGRNFAVSDDRESGLRFEPDEALCDACLSGPRQSPDAARDCLGPD